MINSILYDSLLTLILLMTKDIKREIFIKKVSFCPNFTFNSYKDMFAIDFKQVKTTSSSIKKRNSIKNTKNDISKNSINELIIKKYNNQLVRHLKTLQYIEFIESKLTFKTNEKQLNEISELKLNVRYDILRLSKKINEYNSSKFNVKSYSLD